MKWMFVLELLKALAYVFPAYVANATPVVFVRIIGRATPIDRGASAWDGRRILGDGKTFEGLLSALVFGTIVGVVMYLAGNPGGLRSPLEALTLSAGAMVGDMLGSFTKRRIGVERGGSAPLLDQLGFLLMALLIASALHGAPEWFSPEIFLALLALTVGLHLGTNALAYLLGFKDRPY